VGFCKLILGVTCGRISCKDGFLQWRREKKWKGNVVTAHVVKACWKWRYNSFRYLNNRIKRDQLDVICFIISLFTVQHVSDVNTSILRSLRLVCWVISWVVLLWFDVCGRLVHQTATYKCDDTRGCIMQFWPPDDEHMCSKHAEAWNKLIVRQKFSA